MEVPHLQIGPHEAEYPILGQGMALFVTMPPLVAAIANAGGVGILGGSGMNEEELERAIDEIHHLLVPGCSGTFGVNLMRAMRNFRKMFALCIRKGVPFIFTGAGSMEAACYNECLEAGNNTIPVPIISRPVSLHKMFREGIRPQAVVTEGGDAGGHLGTKKHLAEGALAILPGILETREKLGWDDVPILLAGGGVDHTDLVAALNLGANGRGFGTRFILTEEVQGYAPDFVDVYLNAKEEDVVLLGVDGTPGSPAGLPSRALRTAFAERLLSSGQVSLIDGSDGCRYNCLEMCKYRDHDYAESFCINERLRLAIAGDRENGLFFTGARVGEINDIVKAGQFVQGVVEHVKAA